MKKQITFYLIIGGFQYFLDGFLFAALTLVMPVQYANVLSRGVVALIGYQLNGRFTFRTEVGVNTSFKGFAKYLLLWMVTTSISTMAIWAMNHTYQNEWSIVVMSKFCIEGLIVVLSFLVQKFYIYR